MDTKAIIIAAGKGSRLKPLTQSLPKCLAIRLEGKSLLQLQMDRLKASGVSEFVIIRGYLGEKFDIPHVKYIWNHQYETNNILESLMCAESELKGNVIVSYADIWYDQRIPQKLLASKDDIALAIDLEWQKIYQGRFDNPIEKSETVTLAEDYKISRIGRIAAAKPEIHGEFIGMMKMTTKGCSVFRDYYHRAKKRYAGKRFHHADRFENAYLSDLLQEIINDNGTVYGDPVEGAWKEIDTMEDYKNTKQFLGEGEIVEQR